MKNRYSIIAVVALFLLATACSDKWDDHYSAQNIVVESDIVKIVDSNIQDYVKSASELSSISDIFTKNYIYSLMDAKDQDFTVLVYDNSSLNGVTIDDNEFFAKTCVCDLSMLPTKLTDGYSVKMWNDKYLVVSVKQGDLNNEIYIAGSKLKEVIQTSNGYIYVMESPVFAPKSLYEYLSDLPDDKYSLFKELIFSFEEREFDRDNSTPVGVDVTGNTVYDSIFVTKNTLMDRYNSAGSLTWNMRSEFYSSTMLIYSNDLITNALEDAYENVRLALNREPTAADTLKFNKWIVESAFYDDELTPLNLNGELDIISVAGYQEDASASTPGVQWRPTVQMVNTSSSVELSNGVAYYVTVFKIPNNVVIYRIKNRFYLWSNCTETEKAEYFKLENIETVTITDKGTFGPIGPWPIIYYKVLTANADADAIANKSVVSIEYTGIGLDEDGNITLAKVPPGEYYLRMGFIEKLQYKVNIYFNDEIVVSNVNYTKAHLDRAGAGYPEGFVPDDWKSTTSKAANYDRDGYDIGTVTVKGEGLQTIKIKVESADLSALASPKLYLYNWCLRPTENNY